MTASSLRELFAPEVDTIERADPASHAKRRMDTNETRSLLVVEGDQLVGIIKRNDLLHGSDDDYERPVGEFMQPNVPSVTENHSIEEAHAALGGDINIEQVPVLDAEGRLIGVINRSDLNAAHEAVGGDEPAPPAMELEDGMTVKDSDGSKLGELKEATFTATGDVEFFTVEHGMIFKGRKRLPGDVIQGVQDGELVLAISSMEFGMIKDLGEE